MQEAAAELEQACHKQAPAAQIEALLNKVLTALEPVMTGLRDFAQSHAVPPPNTAVIDSGQIKMARDHLLALLRHDDGAAVQYWHDNESLFQAAFGKHSATIATQLQNFDLDAALAIAQQT